MEYERDRLMRVLRKKKDYLELEQSVNVRRLQSLKICPADL